MLSCLPGVALFLSHAALAASFQVGTFTKSTAAAPAVQAVPHTLGQVPKAVILWTDGMPSEGFVGGENELSFGASDGTSSFSVGGHSRNNASPSSAQRRLAAKVVSLISSTAVVAEADLVSWDDKAFTLSWTANDTNPALVHFIAIGGNEVSAKLVEWQAPGSTSPVTVTGVGFQPALLIHYGAGINTFPVPSIDANVHLNLGAMDSASSWALDEADADAVSPTQTFRLLLAGALAVYETGGIYAEATSPVLGPDGFSVSFSQSAAGNGPIFSLALEGVSERVGMFGKSTAAAPATQSVTGLGFAPGLLFLTSNADVAETSPATNSYLDIGATDGAHMAALELFSLNGLSPSVVQGAQLTSAALFITKAGTTTIEAQATPAGFLPDGFALAWTPNSGAATEIAYVALGPVAGANVPQRLAFTSPPRTLTAGDCPGAASAITLQVQDAFGNPVPAGSGGEVVALASSSAGPVTWYADPGCATAVPPSGLLVASGQSAVSFYYSDARAGTPTLTASAAGLSAATQVEQVNARPRAAYTVGCTCHQAGSGVTEAGLLALWIRKRTRALRALRAPPAGG